MCNGLMEGVRDFISNIAFNEWGSIALESFIAALVLDAGDVPLQFVA